MASPPSPELQRQHAPNDCHPIHTAPLSDTDHTGHSSTDFVTLLKLDSRANKLIRRDGAGKLHKEPGPPIISAVAQTVYVPNAQAMKALLLEVADDPNSVIIPSGYFPGSEPESLEPLAMGPEFHVSSKGFLAQHLGVTKQDTDKLLGWHEINGQRHIARLKANILSSSWMLLDRDEVKGMPEHLATMSDEEWLAAMSEMIPGFADVEKVQVPSSTGPVLVGGELMVATGQHYFVQVDYADDLEAFGSRLLLHSFLAGYGFMRPTYSSAEPDKVTGTRHWSIFDPTTFSRERLAYEGAPTVEGEGLSVAPAQVEII